MTIFEEIMQQGLGLTESTKLAKKESTKKKISYKKLRVESMKITESDEDDVNFDIPEDVESSEEDEVVLVIDPEVKEDEEIPEDAAEQMIGDYVYKCPICGANYVCDCESTTNESIEVDENGVPTECPICGDDADQILIGEISPAEEVTKDDDQEADELPPQEVDEEESEEEVTDDEGSEEVTDEEEEKEEESLVNRPIVRPRSSILVRREGIRRRSRRSSKKVNESVRSRRNRRVVKESYKYNIGDHLDDGEGGLWEIRDIERFGGLEDYDSYLLYPLNDEAREAVEVTTEMDLDSTDGVSIGEDGESIWVDLTGFDYRKVNDEACSRRSSRRESTRINIRQLPRNRRVNESARRIRKSVNESSVLNFDDTKFNSLMNEIIKENYRGNNQFKVVNVSSNKSNTLKIEYVVRESSRKLTRGTFIAEGFNKSANRMLLKMRDKGAFTESYTKTPSFSVVCRVNESVVTPVRISYDFKTKLGESTYRITNKKSVIESTKKTTPVKKN